MKNYFLLLTSILLVSGCANTAREGILESEKSQVQMRSIQMRSFDTTDKKMVMKSAIATLQDLSFVIDQADYDIGTIKATKLSGYNLTMSVTVTNGHNKNINVRASGRYNDMIVAEPKPYQDFFTALSKSLFLEANAVD